MNINNDYLQSYNEGMTIWQIAEKYNDTYKNTYEYVIEKPFAAKNLPIEEKKRICELYNNGLSTVKIGEMYGTRHKPIAKVLEEFNIQRNQAKFVRKYSLDETYFDNIDTPNKAYVVGFLSADGCNNISKGTISMSLEACDKEILEQICIDMKNEHPLEFIDYTNKHDFGYTYKDQYRMLIFSIHMCHQLEKIGVVPNKSLKLKLSESIPKEYYSHYIRGIFDGDGSMGAKSLDTYKGSLSLSITSTYDVCIELQNILNEMGINSRIVEASNHNGITAVLNIDKSNSIKKFLDWIYKDAELYLKRKYDLYLYHYKLNSINNSLVA